MWWLVLLRGQAPVRFWVNSTMMFEVVGRGMVSLIDVSQGVDEIEVPPLVGLGNGTYNVVAVDAVERKGAQGQVIMRLAAARTLKNVTLPRTLARIGDFAFADTAVSRVVFAAGSTLKSIGISAFQRTALVTIAIPPTVREIGRGAFAGSALRSISFRDSRLEEMGAQVFMGTNLTEIVLPVGLRALPESAFERTRLARIVVPAGSRLRTIGRRAFVGCNLSTLQVPPSVKVIEAGAFAGVGATRLGFAAGSLLEVIGHGAFEGSPRLAEVGIPAHVVSIGPAAFRNCSQLSKVVFHRGSVLRAIGREAFDGTALVNVTIPPGVAPFPVRRAFSRCPNLVHVHFEGRPGEFL